ncbi:MAG: sigma-70 family RNA polymerase sigma factor [Terriglobia bacterium]|nr:sigma-70 family RNA polymerase sigma factor [Terriglobia bacterium]
MVNKSQLPASPSSGVEALVQHHAKFLRFLRSQISDSATAEDILHSSYMKALEHENQLRADESIVAWFYRILRNNVIDHYRRRAARSSAHDRYASELPVSYETELHQQTCECVKDLVKDLIPQYREAIEHVDLAGEPLEAFAQAKHITANNASVRLYRARKALAEKLIQICGVCTEHKCLDCTCRRAGL